MPPWQALTSPDGQGPAAHPANLHFSVSKEGFTELGKNRFYNLSLAKGPSKLLELDRFLADPSGIGEGG